MIKVLIEVYRGVKSLIWKFIRYILDDLYVLNIIDFLHEESTSPRFPMWWRMMVRMFILVVLVWFNYILLSSFVKEKTILGFILVVMIFWGSTKFLWKIFEVEKE